MGLDTSILNIKKCPSKILKSSKQHVSNTRGSIY